ncbi:META domain-containing protein [Helicobacter marmotae]|uniref:META domain-containing protein n=1 Tax=Helicobacter marmotae TaxID=152490 RepID=A0A3D8I6Q7_9HELI|nr:META domain-containing protein [Helicobacter marmotae]
MKIVCLNLMALVLMSACFVDLVRKENQEILLADEKQWRVYKFVLQDGRTFIPIWQDTQATMSFDVDENRIFGINICNNYFATFAIKGTKLTISHSGSSRRICTPSESQEFQFHFLQNLEGEFIVRKDIHNDQMRLEGKNATYYLKLIS